MNRAVEETVAPADTDEDAHDSSEEGEPRRAGPERPWARAKEEITGELEADEERGLSSEEARRRLEEHGPNRIRRVEHRSVWRILWEQLRSLVMLLLVGAMAASAAVGQWEDATAIAVVIVVNTAIGFFTELRARRSMEALQKIGDIEATVIRDGRSQRLDAADLVPGDLVELSAGEPIGADLRLVALDDLTIDESPLTGESVPVDKQLEPVDEDAGLADRASMVFKGTAVGRGEGRGVVVGTGMNTEIGQISALVEEAGRDQTPLEKQLDHLARRLVWLTLLVAAAVGAVGVLADRELRLMFETTVALAVAAIPEGLPIVATVALARGMHRMLKRNALVRRLSSVQTLGATNVICTDKTGTLTENRMRVDRLVVGDEERDLSGDGEPPDLEGARGRFVEAAVLCNTATLEGDDGQGEGDPMELALLKMGADLDRSRASLLERMPQQRVEPFDRETNMMATFHEAEDGTWVAVKGAPEAVLDASTKHLVDGEGRELDDAARDEWLQKNETLAADGLRVLAVADKTTSSAEDAPYEGLTLLGLVGLMDPPRENVPEAVQACRDAGIRVIMVTGDQPATAAAIARQVRISDDEPAVLHGDDFESSDPTEASVLARVSPKQKLQLIDALQEQGLVVAMTGDGVNDAPALKSADIGVAMGERGTEVAREAADMILQDDAFETIVAAVQEGRVIFDNIRRFVVYLLSGNVGEILAVGVAAVAGWPLPLLPLQILYLNVLNDVFPALALGVGPGSDEVMRRPPRDPGESILSRVQWSEIGGYGAMIGAVVLGLFALALHWVQLDVTGAVTVAFLSLSIGRLLHAFNMRAPTSSAWRNDVIRNGWLWGAIALCVGLLMLAVYFPPLASILELRPLGSRGWALVAGGSLAPLLIGQATLAVRRHIESHAPAKRNALEPTREAA